MITCNTCTNYIKNNIIKKGSCKGGNAEKCKSYDQTEFVGVCWRPQCQGNCDLCEAKR